jgi:hypothetical protein
MMAVLVTTVNNHRECINGTAHWNDVMGRTVGLNDLIAQIALVVRIFHLNLQPPFPDQGVDGTYLLLTVFFYQLLTT